MKLYDLEIGRFKEIFINLNRSALYDGLSQSDVNGVKSWRVLDKEELILKSDMAYELGGGTKAAIGAMAFTTSRECIADDRVFFLGKDLGEIKETSDYARFTVIRLKEDVIKNLSEEQIYGVMKKIDYVRYHVHIEGFMMRVSSVLDREQVRVSKAAVLSGINFASVGMSFIEAYKKCPEVEAVQIYFLTVNDADYGRIGGIAFRCEQITDSLNHIFNGLVMDCSTCNLKTICDEAEGMREMHLAVEGKTV